MKQHLLKLLSEVLGGMHSRGQLSAIPQVEVTAPDPAFGDYSTNVALKVARELKQKPGDVAAGIIRELTILDGGKHFESINEKAGFINVRLSREALLMNLADAIHRGGDFGTSASGSGQKILVEYFQPNVAKPLHLGHLGTAVIGDAIFRLVASQGYGAESDTHLGDWGTQFGILIAAFKKWGDMAVVEKDPIVELNKLYVRMNAEIEENPALRDEGKAEFVKLERGDAENRKLWEQFRTWSWQEYDVVYQDLGVRKHDHDWPESFFEDKMPAVVAALKSKGLLKESQGAQIVDLEDQGLGVAIVQKSDGGTTYLLRDLATFIYRKGQGFARQLYVVDVRQSHTLAQTKKILELLGHVEREDEFIHVAYGYTSLPEGAMSTRKGTVVGLVDVVEKVQTEARRVIEEKNPELKDKETVAKQVANAAIRYPNLARNVQSDLVFRWEQALSFEGATGPYLQYAHARIRSIIRKGGGTVPEQPLSELERVDFAASERSLLAKLVTYPETVQRASRELAPNILCTYLFELAQEFNSFYQAVPVLQAEDAATKHFRLRLCAGTAQVLKNGLGLLGIGVPEEM